jgi:hypothetical protein
MKPTLALAALILGSACAQPLLATPCEDVKGQIAQKLDAKGVKFYTLEVVSKDAEMDADSKVVGVCEGGAKKIVYKRGAAAAAAPAAAEPSKP